MANEEPNKNLPWEELDPNSNTHQKVFLFYGQSGSGKTYLSAQFPKPLILACDPGTLGGALSAAEFKPKHMKIDNYNQLLQLIPILKANAGKEFETLIVDSISYLSRLVMFSILQGVGREIPRFEEWNLNAERIRRLINSLAEVGTNIIFTATDDINKDEMSGKIYGGPNLPGKLAKELPQACDVVLRLFATSAYDQQMKRSVQYKFQSVPDDVWFARDRTRILPPEGLLGTNPIGKEKVDAMFYFNQILKGKA